MAMVGWNCRGLAVATAAQELREINQRYKPAMIFLMETRATAARVDRVRRSLHFPHCFCAPAAGLSGGFCLLCNDQYQPNRIEVDRRMGRSNQRQEGYEVSEDEVVLDIVPKDEELKVRVLVGKLPSERPLHRFGDHTFGGGWGGEDGAPYSIRQ